jgi:hypothetical protein
LRHSGRDKIPLLDALEILRIGYVHRVVPHEQFLQFVKVYAGTFANHLPVAVQLTSGARRCLSPCTTYPTGSPEGSTKLIWGDLHDLHSRYREKKQLRKTVATVELLSDGQVIVDQ